MIKNKKVTVLLLALVVLIQLYVPLQMIIHQETIRETGKDFKFQTIPVDPYDAFRGKYIILSFKEREITVSNSFKWISGETIFATIKTNKAGFAKITSISRKQPQAENQYLKLKIDYTVGDHTIILNFPFDRFYMNENSASKAEKMYQEFTAVEKNKTYALVAIKNGEAVIKDVRINDVSIKTLAYKK